ncbi:MAG TPA: D-glycerate dehydrogenase [Candidatus Aminicenantes bacterium]|nr:D-glycerate dehydrogenase [Candidatus Aminicenantes bacterium]
MTHKPVVVLTHHLLPAVQRDLESRWNLILVEGGERNLTQVLPVHHEARGLISFLSEPITLEVIKSAPNLEIIANYAVGYNNIDVEAAIEKGIWVTHTPDVLTAATADQTMALLLAVARRVVEGDRLVRAGGFDGWASDLMLGRELSGAILGIVGMGRIGTAVAQRAQAFGMRVIYHSRSRKPELEKERGYRFVQFAELAESADIISLHLPYSSKVHHLIDQSVLARMKPDAMLINVARGPLVDEAALARRLQEGGIGGAGLDVYEHEPHVNPLLKTLDNVVLAPHSGSATVHTRTQMGRMVEDSVVAALAGNRPPHLVAEWRQREPEPGPRV